MLLGTLGISLLGNLLTGRKVNKKGKGATKSKSQGQRIIRAGAGATKSKRQGQGIVRAGYGRPSSKNKNSKVDF